MSAASRCVVLLICVFGFLVLPRHQTLALKCQCGAVGIVSAELQMYIASVNASASASASSYCMSGTSCSPASGYGCFRVRSSSGRAYFCGTDRVKSPRGDTMLTGQAGSNWLINMTSSVSSTVNLGVCTKANNESAGLCYCDNADYCNLNAATTKMPDNVELLATAFASVTLFLLAK